MCNPCLSPLKFVIYKNGFVNIIVNITIKFDSILYFQLMLWVRIIPLMVMCTQYNIVSGLRQVGDFLHDVTEIVLKVALSISLTSNPSNRIRV